MEKKYAIKHLPTGFYYDESLSFGDKKIYLFDRLSKVKAILQKKIFKIRGNSKFCLQQKIEERGLYDYRPNEGELIIEEYELVFSKEIKRS